MENSAENVECCVAYRRGQERIREKKNSKFLLIVVELELNFAWCCGGNVWETLRGRSRSAWYVVSWMNWGCDLLRVSQMIKMTKNFSESVAYFGYTREACKNF